MNEYGSMEIYDTDATEPTFGMPNTLDDSFTNIPNGNNLEVIYAGRIYSIWAKHNLERREEIVNL